MQRAPQRLALVGHTHNPRHKVISDVTDALLALSVFVDDVKEFSNRQTTYAFEIDGVDVPTLLEKVVAAGIMLHDPPDPDAELPTDDEGYVAVTLAVSFPDEDGNKKIPNPDMG